MILKPGGTHITENINRTENVFKIFDTGTSTIFCIIEDTFKD